mgnify:CR=1 FL=1
MKQSDSAARDRDERESFRLSQTGEGITHVSQKSCPIFTRGNQAGQIRFHTRLPGPIAFWNTEGTEGKRGRGGQSGGCGGGGLIGQLISFLSSE